MKMVPVQSFIKQYFWTLPFFCFFAGYLVIQFLLPQKQKEMPQLIGKSLQEGLTELAALQLNARLLTKKEDIDSKEGTIVSHIPAAGQKVKTHQTVYIVITCHPTKQQTPSLYELPLEEIKHILDTKKIQYKTFFITSTHQEGTCIGQIPQPQEPLLKPEMIIYISSKNTTTVIFPDLQGMPLEDVIIFLKKYKIDPRIFHTYQHSNDVSCAQCIIKDQRPLPGTLVNLHTPLSVQLKV